ncbi:hypothetical protein SAMN06265784_11423 [Paraburkholderia susongensis]|uniref:Uncharacterized protein n=1 Tax=Paraburkholderia susongensis TaxID=1515439 RepID=A0A1X7M211_9BURK|nr:hypothetical protein SAMN06265784_11423 [Paraburkholderia susongensis]
MDSRGRLREKNTMAQPSQTTKAYDFRIVDSFVRTGRLRRGEGELMQRSSKGRLD